MSLCARRAPRWRRCLAGLLGPALLLALPAAARAQIWGYVDAAGVVHLAAEPLDARYELFSRAGVPRDPAGPAPAAGAEAAPEAEAPRAPEAPAALPPRLDAFFAASAGYQRAQPLLREAARVHGIDYELLKALIVAESGFDAAAVSPKGAIGLMQVMPATAERWGLTGDARTPLQDKLADPRTNVRIGARYLRHLIGLFPGRLDLALAAYNAGEGAVQRAGHRIPEFRETQNYVTTVLRLYALLKPPPPVRAAASAAAPAPRRVQAQLPGVVPGRASMPPPLTAIFPNLTD